jgi:Spy/CpxP family protein refolding chaperone
MALNLERTINKKNQQHSTGDKKMKKLVTAAAILSVIGFAGITAASAHGGFFNNGYGYCNPYTANGTAVTKEDAAAIEKFQADTSDIRKEIVVKRSELNALLSNNNPDEKKVAGLTGDLYDLEKELDAKAEKVDAVNRYGYDRGPGYGYGMGYGMMGGYGGYGMGPGMMGGYGGYGYGPGGHMMGW